MIDDRGDSPWVRHRMLLICALGVLLLIPWLGLRDLWYPDEPVIGEVCRTMFASGDWIAPRLFGEVWADYPPMLYWVGCLFSRLLGGMSEFTLRLPLALAAIGLAAGNSCHWVSVDSRANRPGDPPVRQPEARCICLLYGDSG